MRRVVYSHCNRWKRVGTEDVARSTHVDLWDTVVIGDKEARSLENAVFRCARKGVLGVSRCVGWRRRTTA